MVWKTVLHGRVALDVVRVVVRVERVHGGLLGHTVLLLLLLLLVLVQLRLGLSLCLRLLLELLLL